MATRCIICERETSGAPIKEDAVIGSIRRIKQALRMAQNNRLVVCRDCTEAHRAKREKFEKSLVQNIVLGGIIFLGLAIVPLFTKAGFQPGAAIVGLLFLLGLVLLTVLTSYSPALAGGGPPAAHQAQVKNFEKKFFSSGTSQASSTTMKKSPIFSAAEYRNSATIKKTNAKEKEPAKKARRR